jgi:hypothetical protein
VHSEQGCGEAIRPFMSGAKRLNAGMPITARLFTPQSTLLEE